jgi:hypothetical protein
MKLEFNRRETMQTHGDWTMYFFLGQRWDLGLNSELPSCKVGVQLLEPHLQSILLCLFWRWSLTTICPGWPQTVILPVSVSQVARIIGMSYWWPAWKNCTFEWSVGSLKKSGEGELKIPRIKWKWKLTRIFNIQLRQYQKGIL